MNELEKAVVQAAIAAMQIGQQPSTAQLTVLRQATHELIFGCQECNTDRHRCPGCGTHVPHGQVACSNCAPAVAGASLTRVDGTELEEPPVHAGAGGQCPDYGSKLDPCPPGCASGTCVHAAPPGQRVSDELERDVAGLALDTVKEWLKYTELSDGTRVRCVLYDDPEGEVWHVENMHGQLLHRFQLTTQAKLLPSLPPLGPENDLGVFGIGAEEESLPQWRQRPWRDVRTKDTVRAPGTDAVAEVTARYRHPSEDVHGQDWHVVAGAEGHWQDRVPAPGEVVVSLDGQPPRWMKPDAPVDILIHGGQPEVDAIEALGWDNRIRGGSF